jgi:hypothetical protein
MLFFGGAPPPPGFSVSAYSKGLVVVPYGKCRKQSTYAKVISAKSRQNAVCVGKCGF